MDSNILIEKIKAAVGIDAVLNVWCNENYEKDHTVIEGINLEDLPVDSDYPLIAISRTGKRGGKGAEKEEFYLVVGCGIVDDSDAVKVGNIVTMTQLTDLEKFRQLVVAAIDRADLDGGYVEEVEVENEAIEAFPYFGCHMEVKIVRPYVFRENWLE